MFLQTNKKPSRILQNMAFCVLLGIAEAFTCDAAQFLFTFDVVLFTVTLAICL